MLSTHPLPAVVSVRYEHRFIVYSYIKVDKSVFTHFSRGWSIPIEITPAISLK